MLVVLGLGNPGDRYSGTRHNVGKNAVTALAGRLGLRFKPGAGEFLFAEDPSRSLILAVNTTYMNSSGVSAVHLMECFGTEAAGLLVVCDDFNIPFRTLRIRCRGSDGGHNGLGSIIYSMRSEDFPRLRLGIGPVPAGVDPADFVLGEFAEEEVPYLAAISEAAGEAVLLAAGEGVERAMNEYNNRLVE